MTEPPWQLGRQSSIEYSYEGERKEVDKGMKVGCKDKGQKKEGEQQE